MREDVASDRVEEVRGSWVDEASVCLAWEEVRTVVVVRGRCDGCGEVTPMPDSDQLRRLASLGILRAMPLRDFPLSGWIQISGLGILGEVGVGGEGGGARVICPACAWFVEGALRARRG